MPKAVTSHDRRQEVEYDRANHEIHGTTRTIGVANSHNSIHKTRPLPPKPIRDNAFVNKIELTQTHVVLHLWHATTPLASTGASHTAAG